MGQSKGGGYSKVPSVAGWQQSALQDLLKSAIPNMQQAAQGYAQFLPGGGGGQAIKDEAMRNYQQQTIPSIMNAFGTGNKGSSALNSALAASGADLNTSLASQLAQMQLSASQGLGSLGLGGSQLGVQTSPFAYLQRQPPLWQQLFQTGSGAGGQILGGWAQRGFQ